jgi:hypothetical protein
MLARTIILLCATTILAGGAAAAERVSADYLVGTWSLDGEAGCGQKDAEKVVIDKDGAFRSYRRGRLESSGMWHVGGQYLAFHVVSSAALLSENFVDYSGLFSSADIEALETKVEPDHLELAVRLGDVLRHWKLDRCK